jgi:hypothetical protein
MTRTTTALRASDVDGAAVVRVQMSNAPGTFATFDAADYDRLRKLYPGPWRLNDNGRGTVYVRAGTPGFPGRNVNLARQTLDPGLRRIVRYRDGDRLNLRRSNLYLEPGKVRPRMTAAERAARDAARPDSVSRKLSPRALQAVLR